jgi:hypothetical protein
LAGQCPDCRREEALQRQAEALVSTRAEERSKRIHQGLERFRKEITRDLIAIKDRRAAEFLESIKLECENEANASYIERLSAEISAAMLQEALEELQAKGA